MNILNEPIYVGFIQFLISLIIISGLIFLGRIINNFIFNKYNHLFFNLLVGLIIFSQFLKIIVFLGLFEKIYIPLSFLLLISGLYNFKDFIGIKKNWNIKKLSIIEISILFFIFLLLLNSIAPPSMADALDYHYGVPIYLLKNFTLPNFDFWLWGSVVVGNSEIMNSLPMYLGTDNFNSVIQVLSLILFFVFFKNQIKSKEKFNFFSLFILSSPTILQLISGPKFMLIPQLMTTSALYLFIKLKKINTSDFIFISILLMGATQFKSSFIISGAIIGLITFFKAIKSNQMKILFYSFILTSIFFFPTALWNYNQLINFNLFNIFSMMPAEMMETMKTWRENDYIFPVNLFFPSSLGKISTIIGFQIFLIFFTFSKSKDSRIVLFVIFSTVLLQYFLGMNVGRVYFEFILWSSLYFVFINKKINFKLFQKIILPQFFCVVFLSGYFAVISIPGIFSNDHRDKFMKKNSFEYEIAQWVNETLPEDGKIISGLRSVSFIENDFIPTDWVGLGLSSEINIDNLNNYLQIIKNKKFDYIVLYENDINDHRLKNCIDEKFATSNNFLRATRNPFNRNNIQKVEIFRFNYKRLPDCVR